MATGSPPATPPRSAARALGARRERALVLVAVLGALALFSGKAFTIDDPLFLWLGRHLRADPVDFYGFEVNWYGTAMEMWEVTMNPPLAGYGIALASLLVGWSERALHLAFLVPAALCALGTYALAARFTARPLGAALIGLATPVYLVSATNVMSDGPMLAAWVWTLVLWVRFLDGRGPAHGFGAGLLAGACALTKYFGVALLPLMAVYALARRERFRRWAPPLAAGVLVLAAYQAATTALYGRGLLLGAALYAAEPHWEGGGHSLGARTLIGLAYGGACLLPALVYAPLVWRRRAVLAALGIGLAGFVVSLRFDSWVWLGPFLEEAPPWHYALQFALHALGGVALVALPARELLRRRDADSLLLALWVLGTLFFATYVNWVNNGRSNLPVAPALGILIARRLEERGAAPLRGAGAVAFGISAAVALGVAAADARWANGVREAARGLAADFTPPDRPLRFYGHWGFQWYMEEAGAIPVDLNETRLVPGDRVVLPLPGNNTNVYPPAEGIELIGRRETPSPFGFHTVSRLSGACFYASVVGPLPWVLGPGRSEDVYLAGRVVRPLVYDRSFDLQVERY